MRITLWPEKDSWFRRNTTLVLCVLTMLMLTLGISEQGATIAQQKSLIQVLAQDSQMLMAMRAQQQADEAQRKADTQVAPNEKTGNTVEQQDQPQASEEQSKDSTATARKRQQTPKADAVIDLREARRVLLRS